MHIYTCAYILSCRHLYLTNIMWQSGCIYGATAPLHMIMDLNYQAILGWNWLQRLCWGAPRFRGSPLDESLFDQHQSTPPLATYISGILRECLVYHLRMLGFCADRLLAHRDSITSSYVTLTMNTRSWFKVAVCKGRVLSQWSAAYSTNSSGCRQLSQLDTVVLVSAGSCLWLLLPIWPQPHRPSDLYSQL